VTFTLLLLRGRPGLRRPPAAAAVPAPSGLPCGAREAGLHRVTRIRSLRSLRSDRHGESDVEACKMLLHAGRLHCAPRRHRGGRRRAAQAGPRWRNECGLPLAGEQGVASFLSSTPHIKRRRALCAGGRLCAAEERSASGRRARASCALQHLTRGSCLSEVNAVNAASSAARPFARAPQGSPEGAGTVKPAGAQRPPPRGAKTCKQPGGRAT